MNIHLYKARTEIFKSPLITKKMTSIEYSNFRVLVGVNIGRNGGNKELLTLLIR